MNTTLTLPLVDDAPKPPRRGEYLWEEGGPTLPVVERVPRDVPVLRNSPLSNKGDIKSLHLVLGCAHRCAYCPSRAHPSHPGDGRVRLIDGAAELLRDELSGLATFPRAVQICPHSDPFPPSLEVQREVGRVVEVLARHNIQAWLMTRGYIRPAALEVLAAHRDHVKVMVGLTTVDRRTQRVLEPLTAPPRLRLRQIERLQDVGVPVQVAVEPLVPGLTDTRDNLTALFRALAVVDVRRVTAGYMYLAPGLQARVREILQPLHLAPLVLDPYQKGLLRRVHGVAQTCFLTKPERERRYAAIKALAAGYGVEVAISPLSNPDFTRPGPPASIVPPRPLPALR